MSPTTVVALILGALAASIAFSRFITPTENSKASATGEALFGAACVGAGAITATFLVAAFLGY